MDALLPNYFLRPTVQNNRSANLHNLFRFTKHHQQEFAALVSRSHVARFICNSGPAASGTLLQGGIHYPRLVRIQHGTASAQGDILAQTNGQFFESSANGVLVVVGQVLHNSDKSIAPQNRRVLFVNPLLDGSGPWTKITAQVEVPNSYDNFYPNYSSALMPTEDGKSLLELASEYDSLKHCGMYCGIKSWNSMMVSPPVSGR